MSRPRLYTASQLDRMRRIHAQLQTVRAIQREWPIASRVTWDAQAVEGCTSQRRAAQDLGDLITMIFGGNRSGKTELVRMLVVAFVLGGDHPATRLWCAINGVDPEQIPYGPGRGWLVALTSGDSKRYHRKQVLGLLPRSDRISAWNMSGRGEAHIEITIDGYDDPAEIYFKSIDQGEAGAQGDECRVIGIDEEPTQAWFQEAEMRVGREPLRIFCSMTPLKGLTWTYDRFVAPANVDGVRTYRLDALDNPHLAPAAREQLRRKYASMTREQVAARRFGRFTVLEGRVYPEWSREVHLVKPFEIPRRWPRIRVMDFGVRNPAAVLWAAQSPDGQLVLYREHYQAGWSLGKHAEHIMRAEGWRTTTDADACERKTNGKMWYKPRCQQHEGAECDHCDGSGYLTEWVRRTWADRTAIQQLMDMRVQHGMFFRPADNSAAGRNDVKERLLREAIDTEDCEACAGAGRSIVGGRVMPCEACGATGLTVLEWGPPGLVVFSTMRHLIREIEGYVYARQRGKADPTEKPVKKSDHLMDALKYLCRGMRKTRIEAA